MSEWLEMDAGEDAVSLTALEDILSAVLQEQAFMFAEHCNSDDIETPNPPFMYARIKFTGPFDGRLGLVFPRELSIELIANMLGVEAEDIGGDDDAADALKELLNIVCGQFLAAAFGRTLVFDLSTPTIAEINTGQWQAQLAAEHTTALLVEDEPVLFELSL